MISMIAATSINGIIGIRGNRGLLWHSKVDLALFNKATRGRTVVMGNNTFKSLKSKPLPGRKNIVLSKNEKPGERNGVIYYNSMRDVLAEHENFVVIGGEEIYKMFMPATDEIVISTISIDFQDSEEVDTYAYFPMEELERDFFMVEESEVIKDNDDINKVPLNIIISKWHRGISNIH